jgi:hypothetical protein
MMIRTHLCPYAGRRVFKIGRWWGDHGYQVELPLHHGPVSSYWRHQLRRAPARACRVDRARWKRRRFVQELRR